MRRGGVAEGPPAIGNRMRSTGHRRDGQIVAIGRLSCAAADRGITRSQSLGHDLHVGLIKLAILQSHLDLDRFPHVGRHLQGVVHGLACPGRNLMIVQRHEDVLRVAAVDPTALSIQHEGVHEMGPGIDLPRWRPDRRCGPAAGRRWSL